MYEFRPYKPNPKNFLGYFMTTDVMWIHRYTQENKTNSQNSGKLKKVQ